jgi:hypothetical protein
MPPVLPGSVPPPLPPVGGGGALSRPSGAPAATPPVLPGSVPPSVRSGSDLRGIPDGKQVLPQNPTEITAGNVDDWLCDLTPGIVSQVELSDDSEGVVFNVESGIQLHDALMSLSPLVRARVLALIREIRFTESEDLLEFTGTEGLFDQLRGLQTYCIGKENYKRVDDPTKVRFEMVPVSAPLGRALPEKSGLSSQDLGTVRTFLDTDEMSSLVTYEIADDGGISLRVNVGKGRYLAEALKDSGASGNLTLGNVTSIRFENVEDLDGYFMELTARGAEKFIPTVSILRRFRYMINLRHVEMGRLKANYDDASRTWRE